MINMNDIDTYKSADERGKQRLEKKFQEDELSYLSSAAAEEFNISQAEIDRLVRRIDNTVPPRSPGNAIFISLLCGLLIGMSVFFVFFHKSKNHPGLYQAFDHENTTSEKSRGNVVDAEDTTLADAPLVEKAYTQEHFASIHDVQITEASPLLMPEAIESKPIASNGLSGSPAEEDLALQFVPNAPVMFIHNLKVTNYRLYYFKNDLKIGLSAAEGVSAQFADDADKTASSLLEEKEHVSYAHQELRDAMLEFSRSHYAACIYNLHDLLKLNAADVNALFYTGMSYYYLMNDAKAIEYFDRVLDSENNIFHQEAEFYKAECLLRLKQNDEAMVLLKRIEKEKGFYSTRATGLLNTDK